MDEIYNNKIALMGSGIQNSNKERYLNFDIYKIVCMLLIIAHHFLKHGSYWNVTSANDSGFNYYLEAIIGTLFVISVNGYVMITGYFGSKTKFRFKKVLQLIGVGVFYALLCYFWALGLGLIKFEFKQFFYQIFFLVNKDFWFFWFLKIYLILYLVSPFLNKILEHSTKKQLYWLCFGILLFCLLCSNFEYEKILGTNNGFSFVWFCMLYLIAGTIRKCDVKMKTWVAALVSLALFAIIFTLHLHPEYCESKYIIYGFGFKGVTLLNPDYSNILVVLFSISMFLLFKNIKLKTTNKNHVISLLASCTLGVYLLHEHPLTRSYIFRNIFRTTQYAAGSGSALYLLLFIVLLFAVGVIIDLIRKIVVKIMFLIVTKIKNTCKKRKIKSVKTAENKDETLENKQLVKN